MTSALPMTPARRRVLTIGVPIAIVVIGATGFNLVAQIGQASYPISYSVPVRAGHVSLDTGGGDLTVRPGGTSTQAGVGRLTGIVHYSLVRPKFTLNPAPSGTAANFECQLSAGNCALDATLEVPAATPVSLHSDGGNLTASGLTGTVSLSTGGGDLTATGLPGDLQLSTNGGNVSGSALVSQNVSAQTGGGDITLTFVRPPRNVRISTSGGSITVVLPAAPTGYDLNPSTAGGSISDSSVSQNTSSPDRITASTDGGDITITQAS